MPRSGWLALGAVAAALAATTPWLGQAWLGNAAVWALLGGSWLAVVAGWRRRPRRTARAVVPAAVTIGAGALLVGARLAILPLTATAPAAALPSGSGPWTATVVAIGNPRDGSQVATVELDGGRAAAGALIVALTAPANPSIGIGDVIRVTGRLEPPSSDDYGAWLASNGIAATLTARSLDVVGSDGSFAAAVDRLRRGAADDLATALPEPEAGLAAGILIGLRDRVDKGVASAFTTAGVSHIVAISGWNIAIVAALVGAALRGWPRRRRAVVTLALVALYTILTGASASVVRAALMTGSVTVARESGRAGSAAGALGWAAVAMLVVDPATVGDAGFQLSSLATAGLIAWGTPLTERLRAWRGGAMPGWLAESLGVSFAAEAATLPIVLLAFGRLALLSPLVNLVAVPLVPPAMAAGTIALVAGVVGSVLGLPQQLVAIVGLPGWAVLAVLIGVVRAAAALPFASVMLGPPWNLLGATICAVAIACVAVEAVRSRLVGVGRSAWRRIAGSRPARRPAGVPAARIRTSGLRAGRVVAAFSSDRRTRALSAVLALSIVGLVLIAAHRADGTVRIDVLDVGQGDAILVTGDHGGRMLLDAGPDPSRLLVALDSRLPPWDRRIDLLVLTHPHEDHVGGMTRLLERYRVGQVIEPGMIGPGPGYKAFASWLLGHDRTSRRVQTGDEIGLDSIRFNVLWPDPGAVPLHPPDTGTAINNVSIVLLGTIDGRRFLLMGDVEEEIDPILIGRGLPHVDVLKVAHHGSRTSSTGPFLDAVRPPIAVISVGLRNPYGHPAPETVDRLEEHGADVYRTDLDGTVDVALERDRWVVEAEHHQAAVSRPVALTAAVAPDPSSALFHCAVPVATFGATPAAPAPPPDPATATALPPGPDSSVGYDRADVSAEPDRGGPPPADPRPPALAPSPLAGGGGDRRLARLADRRPRGRGRPAPRRDGRPAARRRQADPTGRSCGRAPPRRRGRRLAHGARTRRAGARGRRSSGDAARGRGAVSPLGGVRLA
jgi:competence protein ComEC